MKFKDFLGNEWRFECMGCAIGNGVLEVPGGIIKQTNYFCVHQDPLIPLPGFLVIGNIRHIQSISEMSDREFHEFSTLIKITHQAIKQVLNIDHLSLIQEEHSKHFHFWFFPWTDLIIDKYGPPSLSKIRQIMADYKKETVGEIEWEQLEDSITNIRSCLN